MWGTDKPNMENGIPIRRCYKGGDVENGNRDPQITGFAIMGEEGKNIVKKLMLFGTFPIL